MTGLLMRWGSGRAWQSTKKLRQHTHRMYNQKSVPMQIDLLGQVPDC